MIRFVLIGAGRIGRIHAQNLATSLRAKLVAIADSDLEAARRLATQWQARAVGPEEALTVKDADAVLIASSTDTHADWIERCAAAGKPVFCEKPLDLNIKRATQCMRTAERAGIPLYLGFNRRYDPSFAKLKREIDAGAIGRVETLHIVSRDPSPPPIEFIRRSGGLYRDMMIHDFDMARFLVGEEFVTVHALGSALVDPAIGGAGDVDTASVQMQTASGKIAVITNSRRATYGYDQRIEVHGSRGMLRAGNVHMTTVERADGSGFTGDVIQNFFIDRYVAAYAAEVNAFIDAVEKGTKPVPSGQDGLQAQKLAEAATESRRTGQAVRVS